MGALVRQQAEPFLMSSVSHSCHKREVVGEGGNAEYMVSKASRVLQQQARSTMC